MDFPPISMALFLFLLVQTFSLLLVKPIKQYQWWFHHIPETGFGFINGSHGFTETGTEIHFSFDKWITLFYMSMKSGQIKIIQIAISAHLHFTVLEQRANNDDAQD